MDDNIDNIDNINNIEENIEDPLIFNDSTDLSKIKNLLLIDSIITESQLFFDSANETTFPIIYSYNSQRDDFIKLVNDKFVNLERICFVFHDNILNGKQFLNRELFFSENDISDNPDSFSPNTQLLIDTIKQFGVTHVDFLACNSLNYQNWVKFYDLLNKQTNVIVGASNDKTGNLNYGGDWIMESTNENVVHTYFTSNIENYSSTLAVSYTQDGGIIYIQQSGNDIQYQSNSTSGAWTTISSWPVTFYNSPNASLTNILTISFYSNITISDLTVGTGTNGYFIVGSSYITFNGNSNTILVDNVSLYTGLIQNGTVSTNGFHTLTLTNINTNANTSVLELGGGWLCQTWFGANINSISGFNATTNRIFISYCTNSAIVNGINGGGLGGRFCFANSTTSISYCSNSGQVNSQGGGLFGAQICRSGGGLVEFFYCSNSGLLLGSGGLVSSFQTGIARFTSCYNTGIINSGSGIVGGLEATAGPHTLTNCYNTGNINGSSSAGLCNAGGNVTFTNCYNTGNLTNTFNGGICTGTDIVTIINCYNTGTIGGSQQGGIAGRNIRNSSTITNCYNFGNILSTASLSGGIVTLLGGVTTGSSSTISNCYNLGNIDGTGCGGIGGERFSGNTVILNTILNCYNLGNITGNNSGGICGANVGYSSISGRNANVLIQNCYSLGNIASGCGGILGGTYGVTYITTPTINVTNCYTSYNTIVDPSSEYASLNLTIGITYTNVYTQYISLWSDAAAQSALTGAPISISSGNPGSSWLTVQPNTPYLLSNNNQQLYNPNTYINNDFTSYVTNAGLFTDPGYTYQFISVNNGIPPVSNPSITLDSVTGVLSFSDVPAASIYRNYVVAYKGTAPYYYAYNSNTFTLSRIDQSGGTIYIQQSGNNIQYQSNSTGGTWTTITSNNWPLTFKNNTPTSGNALTISFYTNLTISNTTVGTGTNGYFITGTDYITYEGTIKTITISGVTEYLGLIQNGTSVSNGKHAVTVQNINTALSASSTLNGSALTKGGWLCQAYFGYNIDSILGRIPITIYNCTNSANINNSTSGTGNGGIIGGNSFINGLGNISNCSNSGQIISGSSGGIIGSGVTSANLNEGQKVTFTSCANTGIILVTATYSGGISGSNTGNYGYATFTTCTSVIASNLGNYSGCICGSNSGTYGSLTFTTCRNNFNFANISSNLSGTHIGAICGPYAATNGSVTFSYCNNYYTNSSHYFSGICGPYSGNNGTITISYCNNYAYDGRYNPPINYFSGICGAYSGENNGVIIINNCTNNVNPNGLYPAGICGAYVNGTVTITNCTDSVMGSADAGGICGAYAVGNITITNCNETFGPTGQNSGGICGPYSGGTLTITGCTCGSISGLNTGGICGAYAGGTINITNCTANGINGSSSGGICGAYAAGTINITNCSANNTISGLNAGGICGAYSTGIVTITSCSANASISGLNAGGICGAYVGGSMTITKCYNTGSISSVGSGGIAGGQFGFNSNSLCSIINSYNVNIVFGNNSGGICGLEVGYNNNASYTPQILIQNSYSIGDIYSGCGGILGGSAGNVYTNTPTVNITNCYTSYTTITDANSQYVSVNLQTAVRNSILSAITNVYSQTILLWSDSTAQVNLIGAPTSIYSNNPGTNWTTIVTNKPYILSIYNAQIYNPNVYSKISSTSYTTTAGLFTPGYVYSIISVNNAVKPSNININNINTGAITYSSLDLSTGFYYDTEVFVYKGTAPAYYNYNYNSFTLNKIICFKDGSKILYLNPITKEEEYIEIKNLKKGDLVKTATSGFKKIHNIGFAKMYYDMDYERSKYNLYRLSKEKYPELFEDLVITGCHSLLVKNFKDDAQINATRQVLGNIYITENFYRLPACVDDKSELYEIKNVEMVWHFSLENSDFFMNYGVYANGLLVETTSNRMMEQMSGLKLLEK